MSSTVQFAVPGATVAVPAAPTVTFEVASIKRNKEVEAMRATINPNVPTVPGRAQTLPGGTLMGRGRDVIRAAKTLSNRTHAYERTGRDARVTRSHAFRLDIAARDSICHRLSQLIRGRLSPHRTIRDKHR